MEASNLLEQLLFHIGVCNSLLPPASTTESGRIFQSQRDLTALTIPARRTVNFGELAADHFSTRLRLELRSERKERTIRLPLQARAHAQRTVLVSELVGAESECTHTRAHPTACVWEQKEKKLSVRHLILSNAVYLPVLPWSVGLDFFVPFGTCLINKSQQCGLNVKRQH